MIIEKVQNRNLNQLKIAKDDKVLLLNYSSNGDLYITYRNKESNTFEINQKDYMVYELFLELYEDIINHEIFYVDEFDLSMCFDDEDKKRLIEDTKDRNNDPAIMYVYNTLVNNNEIKWYSDDNVIDRANSIIISKEEEKIVLDFKFIDEEAKNTIRISNSGSRYTPFNQPFMKLYNKLHDERTFKGK